MLHSHLCDFSDAYIVVKETITITDSNDDACDKNYLLIRLLTMVKIWIL